MHRAPGFQLQPIPINLRKVPTEFRDFISIFHRLFLALDPFNVLPDSYKMAKRENPLVGGRIPFRWKFLNGLGQAGMAITGWGFGTFAMLYYNQVLGLSGKLSGLAVLIVLLCDAISDPIVGSFSDGFKSRWGRRHPLMLLSIPFVGLSFFGLFWPPAGLEGYSLFAWFTGIAIFMRTSFSFFHVPYMSLSAELSQDYREKTKIAVYRYATGQIAALVLIVVAWNFIFIGTEDNPSPQLNREPYFWYALVSVVLMSVMMLISTIGTMGAIPYLSGTTQTPRRFSLKRVFSDLIKSLRSPPFRALLFSFLIAGVYFGAQGAMTLYLYTFFWQMDTSGIEAGQRWFLIGGLMGVFCTPLFVRMIDKKGTFIFCLVTLVFSYIIPVVLTLAGVISSSSVLFLPLLLTLTTIGAFAGGVKNTITASMMADIADDHELREGVRQEGIYFGALSLAEKCVSATGGWLVGFVLWFINFNPNSTPGEVPESVLFNLGVVYCALVFLMFISISVVIPYKLDRKRHTEILKKLEERRKKADA